MAAAGEEIVIKVPSMGDSITEGTVVQWLKEEGDTVAEDEVIPHYYHAIVIHHQSYKSAYTRTGTPLFHRWWLSLRLIKFL